MVSGCMIDRTADLSCALCGDEWCVQIAVPGLIELLVATCSNSLIEEVIVTNNEFVPREVYALPEFKEHFDDCDRPNSKLKVFADYIDNDFD